MTTRSIAPVISGVVAAIASFIVLLLMDVTFGGAVLFAVLIGLVSAGVTWLQMRGCP